EPMGSARPNVVPDQAFATADGYLTVSVPHDRFWPKLCAALERPDLAADPRFATNAARVAQREALVPALEAVFRARPSAEWVAREALRVVDVSQGVSGPYCAAQLGDLGADVVKLEPPGGDWLRGVGPFQAGESALFLQVNRNKRGVAADLKTAEGRAILEALL